ncbi:hypothetical protein [Staphylococcus shinii]|uniref:hypothetical protein n=1 Tax=Staphylococcus shinii TaxID=2912228 RepID=UPI003F555792
MEKQLDITLNLLSKYDSLISSLATIGSFFAAFFSFIIAFMVFRYNKNKEALNLILNFNREEVSPLYNIDKNQMKEIVNDLKIQIQNPSLSASNILFLNFTSYRNRSAKKIYKNCYNNDEFTFKGGGLSIKNLQDRPLYVNQQVVNIDNGKTTELPLPQFIIEDLVQASYLITDSNSFKYTRKLNLNVKFYHKQKHKLKSKNKVIKYSVRYEGARVLINLDLKPVFIRLFK